MKQIQIDFSNWIKSFKEKRNPRFKKNPHHNWEPSELPFSKAILTIVSTCVLIYVVLLIASFTPYEDIIVSQFATTTNLTILKQHIWTVLLHGFTHLNFVHLLLNMMGLMMAYRLITNIITEKQVWNVFLISVLFGGLLTILCYNIFPYDSKVVAEGKMVGASAGVLGIITVLSLRYPNIPVSMFFYKTNLKGALYFNIGLSVAMIVFNFNAGGGIAHLGGVLVGYLYMKGLNKNIDMGIIFNPITKIPNLFKKKAVPLTYETKYSKETENLIMNTVRRIQNSTE